MRSVDFSLLYDGQVLDVTSKTLEEYNIPPSGVIFVEESSVELTVGLPTGNEKVYSILKNKRVKDLKERIAVMSLRFAFILVLPVYRFAEPRFDKQFYRFVR